MGFSWAFHLAHQCHVDLARRSLPGVPLVRDQTAAPRLGRGKDGVDRALLIYADNANHLGISHPTVDANQKALMEALHEKGLATHDVASSSTLAESLGVRINGMSGQVQPTPHRDWRLDRALTRLAERLFVSGEELQVVVGHMTCRALLNRSLMCILRHSYIFIEKCYKSRQRLWKSVAYELELFRVLMPVALGDFRSRWDSEMLCTDACLSGYAVMSSSHDAEVTRRVGRWDERWRFRRTDGARVAPREVLHDTSGVFEDPLTVKPLVEGEVFGDVEIDPLFPDVPQSLMDREHWHLLWCSKIHIREPVHLIEARSILGAMKHRSRDTGRHRSRLVVLNDNMSVVLSVQKGRCSNYGLLRILRRIAAHSLASQIRLFARWVPSEWNVADADSRRWEGRQSKMWHAAKHQGREEESGTEVHEIGSAQKQCPDERPSEDFSPSQKEKDSISQPREGGSGTQEQDLDAPDQLSQEEERKGHAETDEVRAEAASNSGWSGDTGGQLSQGCTAQGLCEEAERVLQFRRPLRSEDQHRVRPRRGFGGLCRLPVFERLLSGCRKSSSSSFRVREAGGRKKRSTSSAPVPKSFERLAQDGTEPNEAAHGGVCKECHLRSHARPRLAADGVVQRGQLQHLCQTRRALENPGVRCGARREKRRPGHHHPLSVRAGRGEQDRHLRRGPSFRRCPDAAVGPADGGGVQEKRKEVFMRGFDVGFRRQEVSESVEGLCGGSGCSGAGHLPISEPPWGCLTRSLDEAEKCAGHPTERALGIRLIGQDLRQTWSASASPQQVQPRSSAFRRACSNQLHRLLPRWEGASASPCPMSSPQLFQGMSFISLFGGVGNPAKFFTERGGESLVIDFQDSPQNDLGKRASWNEIDKILDYADVLGIDLPCNTWSRARRAPAWSRVPKPLRATGEHIFGLPSLSASDKHKVTSTNVMFRRAIRCIHRSLKRGKTGYLENPWTSLVWSTPEIQRLLTDPRVHLYCLHLCQYGSPWKKPTGLLMWNAAPTQFLTCSGRNKCCRTHRPHLQLSGISGGRFLTEQAQVYSPEFSKALMLAVSTTAQPSPPRAIQDNGGGMTGSLF